MRKNYQTPSLRVLCVNTASVLAISNLAKPNNVDAIDMSQGDNRENIGWSKSFWGLAIDDSPLSADD